jgi:hypothetical protein
MIKSFTCRDTEKLFNAPQIRRFQSFERQAGNDYKVSLLHEKRD